MLNKNIRFFFLGLLDQDQDEAATENSGKPASASNFVPHPPSPLDEHEEDATFHDQSSGMMAGMGVGVGAMGEDWETSRRGRRSMVGIPGLGELGDASDEASKQKHDVVGVFFSALLFCCFFCLFIYSYSHIFIYLFTY